MKTLIYNQEPIGEELRILDMVNDVNIIKMIVCETIIEYPLTHYRIIMEYCEVI